MRAEQRPAARVAISEDCREPLKMGKEPNDYDDVTGFRRLAKDLDENDQEEDPPEPDNSEPPSDKAGDRSDSSSEGASETPEHRSPKPDTVPKNPQSP
jgi:hypothetical protein